MATSIRYGTAATKDGVYDSYAEFLDSGGAQANPGPVWIGNRLKKGNSAVFVPPLAALTEKSIGHFGVVEPNSVNLLDFSSASWLYSTGTGVTAAPDPAHAKEFTATMKIACPATAGVNGQARANTIGGTVNLSNYEYIEVTVWSDEYDYNSPTAGNIYLFTNYSADYYWISLKQLKPGWNIVRIPKSAFASGGTPSWGDIKVVRFQNSSTASHKRTLYYAAVKGIKASSRRACISLGFDDGLLDCHLASVLAAERGIRLTHYVMPWDVGATGHMTFAQIEAIQNMGHEIGMHGPNSNSTWLAELNSIGYDAFVARMIANKDMAVANGWDYEIGSYPQGIYDDLILNFGEGNVYNALRAAGMTYVRGTNNGIDSNQRHCNYSRSYTKSGMWIAGGLTLNNANNLAALQAHVDETIALGAWQNPYGHALAATATDNITWAISDYVSFLDYLVTKRDAGLLDVRPFGEVVRELDAGGYITTSTES